MALSRRYFIGALAAAGIGSTAIGPVAAQGDLEGILDVLADDADFAQTDALQLLIDRCAQTGERLNLPAGRFLTETLRLPTGVALAGVPGRTTLVQAGSGPLVLAEDATDIAISDLVLDGGEMGGNLWHGGLVHVINGDTIRIRDCKVINTGLNGITLMGSSGLIDACTISKSASTGLFLYDSMGVLVTGNQIHACSNGGVRIWRGESGPDGTIVTHNRIWDIDWAAGGNGQNGNGINVFRADEVIISSNHISDCAFSAIRLNATNNTQISANTCLRSGEVAIFSEFAFTGSVISDNIIDTAAGGISITNFNEGGRLAVCSGNIVRNLSAPSSTNPDLESAFGIAAEADAIISDNVIEGVEGTGIAAGWGPYLRDVSIANNLIKDVQTGIAVSLAPDAGRATIAGNTVSGADRAIIGAAWDDVVTDDLVRDALDYPQLSIGGNVVS